jgi:phosphatidylglycerol:prolipoprotein diacylglycerol transferase
MLAIAFIISSYLAKKKAREQSINTEFIFNLAFIVLISGIIGARLLYVILNFYYYIKHLGEIIMLQMGGLSWFGAFFLGSSSAIIYIKKKGFNLYQTLDLIVPFVALGQAIGRIGCLLNGCCFGKPSPSGLYFIIYNQILIPVQLYSSLSLLLIFFVLRVIQDRPHRDGDVLFAYLMLYSIKRFLMEFLRADNEAVIFGLTVFHLISLAVFLLCIVWRLIITKPIK